MCSSFKFKKITFIGFIFTLFIATTSLANTNPYNNQLDAIESNLPAIHIEVNKVGAAGASLAALNPLEAKDRNQIMVGTGHYDGRTCMAVGIAHSTNKHLLAHASTTINTSHPMVAAGISVKYGHRSSYFPAKTRKIVDAKIKDLQQEINMLKAQVKAMKN